MFPDLTELIPTPGSVYVLLLPHLFLTSWLSWSHRSFSSTIFPPFHPPLSPSSHNVYLYLEPFYFFDCLINICPLQNNVRFCWTRIIPFVLLLVSPEPNVQNTIYAQYTFLDYLQHNQCFVVVLMFSASAQKFQLSLTIEGEWNLGGHSIWYTEQHHNAHVYIDI